jgi:hypothetical protein
MRKIFFLFVVVVFGDKKSVLEKGLVSEKISAKGILKENTHYCESSVSEKLFPGTTLAYVTPWNNHGYDIAKVFNVSDVSINEILRFLAQIFSDFPYLVYC